MVNRLLWVEESGSGRVVAYNKDEEMLGYLEYERCGQFMHWKWYQFQDIGMTGGCLDEVAVKRKELYKRLRK